jgi:hypothetical protein
MTGQSEWFNAPPNPKPPVLCDCGRPATEWPEGTCRRCLATEREIARLSAELDALWMIATLSPDEQAVFEAMP